MTENLELLPTWEELQRDYILPGLPLRFVLRIEPGLHLFVDEGGFRIGARFEIDPSAPATPTSLLQQIAAGDVAADGKRWLEISTTSKILFSNFYSLISQVAERVVAGDPPQTSLADAISLWETLLREAVVLSDERQMGLFGELLLLERLIIARVESPIAAWVGPAHETHDFRWGDCEFEVKSTSSRRRVHKIHGVNQLAPSVTSRLYLVSVQLSEGGAGGVSLPELVERIKSRLKDADLSQFNQRLNAAEYIEAHASHYAARRRLRTPLLLVPIVDGTPRIVPQTMQLIPPHFAPERITRIDYDVDITGLGHEDGTQEFLSVIPASQEKSDVV